MNCFVVQLAAFPIICNTRSTQEVHSRILNFYAAYFLSFASLLASAASFLERSSASCLAFSSASLALSSADFFTNAGVLVVLEGASDSVLVRRIGVDAFLVGVLLATVGNCGTLMPSKVLLRPIGVLLPPGRRTC